MDAIKMLWEKIDRESEGTWRYEVFRDNIEKYLPKEEVAEECPICKKHRQDAVEDAKKWVEKVNLEYNLKSEPKKIEPIKRIMSNFQINGITYGIEGYKELADKINEIILHLNKE